MSTDDAANRLVSVESTVTWVLGGVSGKKKGQETEESETEQTVPISP